MAQNCNSVHKAGNAGALACKRPALRTLMAGVIDRFGRY